MADYTDIMVKALGARRAFQDTGKGGGGGMSAAGGGRDERFARDKMKQRKLGYEKAEADIAGKEASTELTKAETKKISKLTKQLGIPKEQTELEKAETRKVKLDNIALGLKNAVSHLPAVTRDSYGDYHNWITESNFVPKGTFLSPMEVAKMTPLEFKAYKSSLTGLQALDSKGLAALEKKKAAELIADAKVVSAEKTATAKKASAKVIKAQELVTRLINKFEDPEYIPEGLKPAFDSAIEIINEQLGVGEQPPEDNRLASQKVLSNMQSGLEASQGAAPEMAPDVLEAFKAKYPDKTDEEIIEAYSRLQQ